MKTVGLITEYNPFHNGHMYHLQQSLKETDAEVAVAVMSGHFLQRGEPALVDKWIRAEMALAAGVDLVVELPLPWACSSAPDFARGGVQALNALGGIDALCFGSEAGELQPLQSCAEALLANEKAITARTAELLRQGVSFPQAQAHLLTELLPDSFAVQAMAEPNNILGIEYLKALHQTASSIEPVTIQRVGAGYHDTRIGVGGIASATGIRQLLAAGERVDELIPVAAMARLQKALDSGWKFSAERYYSLLLGQILREPAKLDESWLIEHGIEQRLLVAAEQAADLEEFISAIKSRQLTRTRVQRLLAALLLAISEQQAHELFAAGPRYLHLLAASAKGRKYLSRNRKQRQLPLVQNFSRIYAQLKRYYGAGSSSYQLALSQLELELRATRLYGLLLQDNRPQPARNRDFYQALIQSE